MELPRYETDFNNKIELNELSDFSFETNARLLLEGYFEFLPSLKAHLADINKLTSTELLTYNNNVAQILYGHRILKLFKNNQYKEITDLSEIIKKRILQPKIEILESINFNNIAQLLIRPEARFLAKDIKLFLQEKGYEIVLEHSLVVDLRQYWMMYNEGFIKSNLYDFPTRTLVYTHGESKILVLYKQQDDLQDHLNAEFKGSAGIPSSAPTLRGTIILNGFEKAKKENKQLFYNSIDPLGMYRTITSGKLESNDPYTKCEDPILYYAGQGIHLPEGYEISTNTGVLLNIQQLKELSARFKKNNTSFTPINPHNEA